MAPIDFIVLGLVAIAFVAVCVRVRRKGTCADCSQAGSCSHASTGDCPACKGVDQIAEDLRRGIE